MRRRPSSSRPINRRRLGALALGLVGLSVILLEALRATHRRPHLYLSNGSVDAPAVVDARFTRALEVATGMRIDPGNRVSLLLNGDGTYPSLWHDLADARRTITMQMYYALPGRVSDTLARILCDRARHGVQVRLLLDAIRFRRDAAVMAKCHEPMRRRGGAAARTGVVHDSQRHGKVARAGRGRRRTHRLHRRVRTRRLLARRRTPSRSVARDERPLRGTGGGGVAGRIRRGMARVDRRVGGRRDAFPG